MFVTEIGLHFPSLSMDDDRVYARSAFPDGGGGMEGRDFLYRLDQDGSGSRLTILSPLPPPDPCPVGHVKRVGSLRAPARGERTAFALRVVPEAGGEGLAMKAYRRAVERGWGEVRALEAVSVAVEEWLDLQGERAGFRVVEFSAVVSGLSFRSGGEEVRLEETDFRGVVEVVAPAKLERGIEEGFGEAKEYGYGLMLIGPWVREGDGVS